MQILKMIRCWSSPLIGRSILLTTLIWIWGCLDVSRGQSTGPAILADFRSKAAPKIAADQLSEKYPPVFLHAYRYAANSYLQSAYSFTEETSDPVKHRNDVQLLFGNGPRGKTLQVNMSGGQQNSIADLGSAPFEVDPDPSNLPDNAWQSDQIEAQTNHIYLEKIHDSRGNQFSVLIKVLAIDPQDRGIAFLWRRLPGGKVVHLQANDGPDGIAGHNG